MKGIKMLGAAVLIMAFLAAGSGVYAADTAATGKGGWKVGVAPYAWLAGLSGDLTVKGVPVKVDESFSDLTQYLDFGAMLHAEAVRDRTSILFDTAYIKLSENRPGIDIHYRESITEIGGAYRVLGEAGGQEFVLEGLGGVRFWYMKTQVNILSIERTDHQDWIDPFLGVRARMPLTKDLALIARLDFGGFDVGSKRSWNAEGTFLYRMSDWIDLGIGYRALSATYEHGNPLDKFGYDATMAGPMIGVLFTF